MVSGRLCTGDIRVFCFVLLIDYYHDCHYADANIHEYSIVIFNTNDS